MSNGLRFQGFKQTSKLNCVLLAFFFFATLYISNLTGGMLSWGVKAAGIGLLYSANRGQGSDHRGEKIDLLIPWENIAKASFNKASDIITIQVTNLRIQKDYYKKGELFFCSSTNPDDLLSAVIDRNSVEVKK